MEMQVKKKIQKKNINVYQKKRVRFNLGQQIHPEIQHFD